ncbi:Dimethyladenosine Transferase 2 [Manis pentadactyla]|nr:Dimethyladenosine Transferase 2 [Manis pentadactyla]
MWAPVSGLPPRQTLSALTGAVRFCILGSGVARRKEASQWNCRGLSDFHPQLLPSLDLRESPSWVFKYRSEPRRYVTSPRLAETLAQVLRGKGEDACQLLLECNPGPGILTQALLESGAKVIALESEKFYIPHLESLGKNVTGKLEVVHCDFFKLDPVNCGIVKPPIMMSEVLFKNLGIKGLPWTNDIPFRVVGTFPVKNERKILWKLLHDIYSCTSVYAHGRVELNMFINEKDYQKITATPENPKLYQALSVLWQVAYEIKLLHMEPRSSFDIYSQNGQLEKPKRNESLDQPQQNLCFVQLIPRRNLFTENLTPINYDVFFHMVRHFFMKRNAKLIDHLQLLSPIDAMDILKQIDANKKTKIVNMYPQGFKQLFETIECSKEHSCNWLYDDFMEYVIT